MPPWEQPVTRTTLGDMDIGSKEDPEQSGESLVLSYAQQEGWGACETKSDLRRGRYMCSCEAKQAGVSLHDAVDCPQFAALVGGRYSSVILQMGAQAVVHL